MNKTLLTLALVGIYNLNAQTSKNDLQTALKTNTDNDLLIEHVEQTPTQVTINTALSNSSQGYIWGPLGFPSTSIVRMGKDFSTFIFKVDGLPIDVKSIT